MTRRGALLHGAVCALAILTGCVGPQTRNELPEPVARSVGRYDTVRQFETAPTSLRREPAAGHPYDWLDRQHAEFRWITAPALGEHVMFLEWRRGGPDGPISRQRVWVFNRRDAGWVMDFYTLPDGGGTSRSRLDDDFRGLSSEQLVGYGDTCSLLSTRTGAALVFSIPPTCSIVARSGRRMQLSAVVRFEPDRILYREQGVLDGGAIAFLVPGVPGLSYEFVRERVGPPYQ